MYKTVWNFMYHHVKSSHVSAMFLAALLAGWTLIGLLAGSVVCLISTISLSTKTIVLFCSAGYTGLIFGFFGGIFYLYQKNVPRKESSIHSRWGRRKMVCSS